MEPIITLFAVFVLTICSVAAHLRILTTALLFAQFWLLADTIFRTELEIWQMSLLTAALFIALTVIACAAGHRLRKNYLHLRHRF